MKDCYVIEKESGLGVNKKTFDIIEQVEAYLKRRSALLRAKGNTASYVVYHYEASDSDFMFGRGQVLFRCTLE